MTDEVPALQGAPAAAATSAAATRPRDWRERWRVPLLVAGPLLVIAAAAYFYFARGRFQSTDDAYVMAARVAVSASVAGRVVELPVHENQAVHRGDLLFRLDDAPFRIAVQQAEAQLASAALQLRALQSSYRQRLADLDTARQTQVFRESEVERQQRLQAAGIVSRAQLDRALNERNEARGAVSGLQQALAALVTQLGGDPTAPVARHPQVLQAQAALDKARLDLSYTEVHAPADGVVTRVDRLQVGSYVALAEPLFALVSNTEVWVEANFKENQLAAMQPGQPARVTIDSLPGHAIDGHVASLSPGTGSQFSILPPENATGNWVKVVQRLPVRIELPPAERARLHAGLSAIVEVDTRGGGAGGG